MKKIITLIVFVTSFVFSTTSLYAQTPDEVKFIGKWTLTVEGVPDGDGDKTLPMSITYNKERLGGTIKTIDGETVKFKSVVVYDDNVMSAMFEVEGNGFELLLSLSPDGILSGTMLGFIQITGEKEKVS